MQHEAAAEWSKTGYISKLPDPTMSSMFFTPPMNFEPDRQVAETQVMQMIPWLGRLKAEAQRAHLEALVAETQYQAERVRVVGDIRANWFKLYVLGKQIETTTADQKQLESLITIANARIRTGDAQPGDVLMATLELSSLQEQLLTYRQQVAATTAELNRLVGRQANTPIVPPTKIEADLPEWNHDLLKQVAMEMQPELNAARLRTAATRCGIDVARLRRRPDFSFGVGWVFMDAPGALQPDAGRDSLTLGAAASIPISQLKYDAMTAEASNEHHAAHASEDETVLSLDALLLDLWEQASASHRTVELYEKSILPQARQTFEADQKRPLHSFSLEICGGNLLQVFSRNNALRSTAREFLVCFVRAKRFIKVASCLRTIQRRMSPPQLRPYGHIENGSLGSDGSSCLWDCFSLVA